MMPALARRATGRTTPDDERHFEHLGLEDLQDLQGKPHAGDCYSHHIGSVEFPHCSCGLSAAIDRAGGRTRR